MDSFRHACLAMVLLVAGIALPHGTTLASSDGNSESGPVSPSTSQDAPEPLLGVVWTPPRHRGPALRALEQIHEAGATAVRLTRLPQADTVLTLADSLGLRLFVDHPAGRAATIDRIASRPLSDTLSHILALARQHPSIQYVGHAGPLDTTVPATCSALRAWTETVHAQSDGSLQTYYVTPFTAAADWCASAVDLPLLDTRGHPAPGGRWAQWQSVSSAVGLGAVGTWVRPGTPAGLRVPHSPERQARYLEQTLAQLLDSTDTAPAAVFVDRWRDGSGPPLPSRRYGLHTAADAARPAAKVVQGFYTGTQRVFAFPSGSDPVGGHPFLFLIGWGVVALLGGIYARTPLVRRTAARYFTAHGFYQDALREGRDLSSGANRAILGIIGVALGVMGTLLARAAADWFPSELMLSALSPTLRGVLAGGLEHPWRTGLAIGGGALCLLLVWSVTLTLVARRENRFSPSQGLMLVVWPCWSALPAMMIALVVATSVSLTPRLLVFLLLGGLVMALYSTARTLVDYGSIVTVSPSTLGLLVLPSPPVLTSMLIVGVALRYDVPVRLLWSLLTQT